MADTRLNLDFLPPEKREFLRRRLEQHDSALRRRIERMVDEAMDDLRQIEAGERDQEPQDATPGHRPIDDFVSCHTPESLARAREADRELTRTMKELVGGKPTTLMAIAGVIKGPDKVTSENYHDYLYGEWEDEE